MGDITDALYGERGTHDPWAHYAEPDRPAPVDPTTVRVGDVVEVTQRHDSPPLRTMVEGEVYEVTDDARYAFRIRGYGTPEITDVTTVRVLRPAEPDPAQVAVLAEHVAQVDADLNMFNVVEPLDYARELYRRGVRAGEVDGDG